MLHRHKHGGLGVRGRTVAQDAENLDNDGVTEQPVGFQNLAMGGDLGFYAAHLFVDEGAEHVAHRRRNPGRRLHGSSAESRSVK
jgi:hypothetical protein